MASVSPPKGGAGEGLFTCSVSPPKGGAGEGLLFTTMNGKLTCKMLKSVRKQIADANNIDYEPRVCHFEGNCRGTCPACEAEMRYLESQLSLRQAAGKVIKIVGLATGISAAMASCSSSHSTLDIANTANSVASSAYDPLDTDKGEVDPSMLRDSDSSCIPMPTPTSGPDNTKMEGLISSEKYIEPVVCKAASIPESFDSVAKSEAQIEDDDDVEGVISMRLQIKALYPGGTKALKEFLKNNIVYPKSAIESKIQGEVIVEFVIEKDGSVSNVKVVHSVTPALDHEAVRVVKLMKGWIPAKDGSKNVKCKFRLPVTFKFQ